MTFEEIDNEVYIVLDGETIGRIISYEQEGVFITFEGSDAKLAKHSIEEAKAWLLRDYQEFLETFCE